MWAGMPLTVSVPDVSGAVRSQETEAFAFFDGKGDMVDGFEFAVFFAKFLRADDCFHFC